MGWQEKEWTLVCYFPCLRYTLPSYSHKNCYTIWGKTNTVRLGDNIIFILWLFLSSYSLTGVNFPDCMTIDEVKHTLYYIWTLVYVKILVLSTKSFLGVAKFEELSGFARQILLITTETLVYCSSGPWLVLSLLLPTNPASLRGSFLKTTQSHLPHPVNTQKFFFFPHHPLMRRSRRSDWRVWYLFLWSHDEKSFSTHLIMSGWRPNYHKTNRVKLYI